jgi:hypothetical protein
MPITTKIKPQDRISASSVAIGQLRSMIDFDNIAALRSASVSLFANGNVVTVLGYYSPGDIGGGSFYYDLTSSLTDNGGTVIAPSVGAGRWIRVVKDTITPQMFGAKADNSTDCRAAFQGCIDAVSGRGQTQAVTAAGATIYVPGGNYKISSRLFVNGYFYSRFEGQASGYGSPAAVITVTGLNEPLFELRSVKYAHFANFTVYFTTPSGYQLCSHEDSYVFLSRGQLYLSTIENIEGHACSGFIRFAAAVESMESETYPTSSSDRDLALAFQCAFRNITSQFGRIAILHGPNRRGVSGGGSGSTWDNIYLSNAGVLWQGGVKNGITYSPQAPALNAICYSTSVVNEYWERVNIEWTNFGGSIVYIGGQHQFNSLHLEGISFWNTTGISKEYSIFYLDNLGYCDLNISSAHLDTSLTRDFAYGTNISRINIFELSSGISSSSLCVNNFNIFNLNYVSAIGDSGYRSDRNTSYELHRLRNSRCAITDINGVKEANSTFHSNSLNWDSGRPTLTTAAKSAMIVSDHFTTKNLRSMDIITAYGSTPSLDTVTKKRFFNDWELNVSHPTLTPLPDIIVDPISNGNRRGVLKLQTGTTQYATTTLTAPNNKIKFGIGQVTLRVGIAVDSFWTSTNNSYIFALGLISDISNPDYIYGRSTGTYGRVILWSNDYSASSIGMGMGGAAISGVYNTDAGFTGGLSTAQKWEDIEIVISADGYVSWYVASKKGKSELSGQIAIPSSSPLPPIGTEMYPFIYLRKSGDTSPTNFTTYVDYFELFQNNIGTNGLT